MTKPIKCYVLARNVEDAQSAAHDVDWVDDDPNIARPFPEHTVGGLLFEVTISAKPYRPKMKEKRKAKP